jgi:hypothetical protein
MRHERRTCAKLCHSSGGELEQIQFLLGHASVQTNRTLSGLQTESRTSSDRPFELTTEGRPDENDDDEPAPVKAPDPVEKASGQGVECRHGRPDHDQPVWDARELSLPEPTDLVEVRKGHRPHSLRHCSVARASRGDSTSKEDGQPDPGPRGWLLPRTVRRFVFLLLRRDTRRSKQKSERFAAFGKREIEISGT